MDVTSTWSAISVTVEQGQLPQVEIDEPDSFTPNPNDNLALTGFAIATADSTSTETTVYTAEGTTTTVTSTASAVDVEIAAQWVESIMGLDLTSSAVSSTYSTNTGTVASTSMPCSCRAQTSRIVACLQASDRRSVLSKSNEMALAAVIVLITIGVDLNEGTSRFF